MYKTELLACVEALQPVTSKKLCEILDLTDPKSKNLISAELSYYFRKRYLRRTNIKYGLPLYEYELTAIGEARLHSARKRAARLLAEQLHGKTPGIYQGIP